MRVDFRWLDAGGVVIREVQRHSTGCRPFTALPIQIYQYIARPQEEFKLIAAAAIIVLLVILLTMNAFAIWLRNRYQKRW